METAAPKPATKINFESVFDRIALSLSGGGFRAAAYSLGTLNALYLLGLLDHVHLLSTASGGTLTGLFYAARRKQGDSFASIYAAAYDWLSKDEILPDAIENWRQAVAGRGADIKLIQAFANAYDQGLYQRQHFGVFWQQAPPKAPFHLQSVILGATELYSGLTFRFQHAALLPAQGFTVHGVKQPQSYYVGNGNVSLSQEHAKQLRLGDIAAASSCFPVGFEPLVLPDDFENASGPKLTLNGRKGPGIPEKIAIIDGGVYDNQGIESLLRANERNEAYCQSVECQQANHSREELALLKPTSLFLVADVDAASTGLYDATQPIFTPDNGPSLRFLIGCATGVVVGMLAASYLLKSFGEAGGFLAGSLLVLGGLGALLLLLGWWIWRKLTARLWALDERIGRLAVPIFRRLTLGQWAKLLTVRVRTASVLLQSVFTRRVRSQNYSALYDQDKPARQAPIVASIIGGLVRDYPRMRNGQRRDQAGRVQQTVQMASEMSTTLWWGNDRDRLPAIVTSAGLTLCYRLLKQFENTTGGQPASERDQEVIRRAKLLWEAYAASSGEVLIGPDVLAELVEGTCTPGSLLAAAQPGSNPSSPQPPSQPA